LCQSVALVVCCLQVPFHHSFFLMFTSIC